MTSMTMTILLQRKIRPTSNGFSECTWSTRRKTRSTSFNLDFWLTTKLDGIWFGVNKVI